MTKEQAESLQLIAVLLQYPDKDLLGRLDELASIAECSCSNEIKPVILAFLNDLGQLTPTQAQERYTAVFDMDPATTLDLTYHLHGDNQKRAAALALLQRHYEQAGWQRITGELPDYLPMMLEFLSICTRPKHTAPIWRCLQGMQPLIEGLKKRAPTYAALLQPIARMAMAYRPSIEKGDLLFEAKA